MSAMSESGQGTAWYWLPACDSPSGQNDGMCTGTNSAQISPTNQTDVFGLLGLHTAIGRNFKMHLPQRSEVWVGSGWWHAMLCAFKFGITQKFWLDAPNDLGAHQPIKTQGDKTTNINPVLTSRDPGSLEGLHICGTSNATEVIFHLLHLPHKWQKIVQPSNTGIFSKKRIWPCLPYSLWKMFSSFLLWLPVHVQQI